MVNKRLNKKKFTEAVDVSVEENDSDEKSTQDNEPSASKKSKVDEKVNDLNAGKKSQKGATRNAKSAKKVTENEESENDGDNDSKRPSTSSDKNKKSNETSNGGGGENEGQDEMIMMSDNDEPVAKNSKRVAKANGKNVKSNKSNDKGKKTVEASKTNDDEGNEADDDDEEEEEYEVQEIIDSKMEGGKKIYLVRWKNYSADDDTWEPKDSLSCKELIDKFEKKKEAGSDGKAKKAVKSPAKPAAKPVAKGRKGEGKSTEDPSKEWEVEKIIDYAEDKNGFVYRIRWKGYGAQHDTWEPRANLFCDDLIEKFDKRVKELQNVSFKELREEPKKPKRLVNETAPRTSYHNKIGRTSKRSVTKKRVYYGDSDE